MLARLTQRMRRTDRNDGFIIVAVLWILAALATLASVIAVYVINTATAFTVHDERVQAEALTRAGLELSLYNIVRDAEQPPSRGTFAFRMGTANVATEFNSETARIDLNAAPKALLAGLFVGLGVPRRPPIPTRIASSDGGRRPQSGLPDEAALYRSAGPALFAARRPVPARRGTRPGDGHPRSGGGAREPVPHGLFGPGAGQHPRRGSAGDRGAAWHESRTAQRNPGAARAGRPAGRRSASGAARAQAATRHDLGQQGNPGHLAHRVRQRATGDKRSGDLHTRWQRRNLPHHDLARRSR